MRTALPTRRQNIAHELTFDGQTFTVCVGFDSAGAAREVFADGHKEGSAMQAFLDDACIVVSIALQHGIAPVELAHSLGTVPGFENGVEVDKHASPVGAIMGAVAGSVLPQILGGER